MEVDHIIPVHASQTRWLARMKAKRMGDINSLENLVPSCHKCNMRKGPSLGYKWRWRAYWGKREGYWVIRRIAIAIIVFVVLYFVLKNTTGVNILDALKNICSNIPVVRNFLRY